MAPGLMWLNSVQGLTTVIPTFTPAKQSLLSGTRKLVSIWFALDPETQQTKKQNKFSLANSHVQWLTQAGWEPHLFCNVYHYKQDDYLLERYPHRMWQCGCDHSFWCFDAGQCGWTNNPIMYGRDWWLKNFVRLPAIVFSTITESLSPLPPLQYEISQKDWNRIFEAGTYYSHEWLMPHWVVAEGDGLFRHEEVGEGDSREFY